MKRLLILVIHLFLLLACSSANSKDLEFTESITSIDKNFNTNSKKKFEKYINQYLHSAVTIFPSFDNDEIFGSGFIIDDGKVVTNLHCLNNYNEGYIVINGTSEKHKIDGFFDFDSKSDLIIFSVPTLKKEVNLILADSLPKIGDSLFAFENPHLSTNLILDGSVVFTNNSKISGIIQTSIPAKKGNSGTALFNSKGQLIGVLFGSLNSSFYEVNSSCAIDLNFLKKLLKNKNKIKKLINPDDAIFNSINYLISGENKLAQKDYVGALLDYNKSLELNPHNFFVYYNRANARLNLKDFEGCIDDCNKSLDIIPNFILTLNIRGLAKNQLNKYELAIEDFIRTTMIDPEYAPGYFLEGNCRMQLNDIEEGFNNINKAIKIDPNNSLYIFTRGGYRFFVGEKMTGCKDCIEACNMGYKPACEFYKMKCK